jgi:DNA-binding transcriptional regulator YhcF (GntR family)
MKLSPQHDDQNESAVAKVCSHFAEKILSGDYPPEAKLPSTRDSARDLDVHHITVAEAYRRLERKGLLEIRDRVGAFVRPRESYATSVLIMGAPMMEGTSFATLASRLAANLAKRRLPSDVKIVHRDPSQLQVLLDWLTDIADHHRLRGVWIGNLDHEWVKAVHSLLADYGIQTIHISPSRILPLSVEVDIPTALQAGVRYLHAENCQRIALLAHSLEAYTDWELTFRSECQLLGLDFEVMSQPQKEVTYASMEHFGEHAIKTLLDATDPPDGILIADDFIGRGILPTLLSRGIRIPDDLKICTHCRRGDAFPSIFGLPIARIESDTIAVADAASDLLDSCLDKRHIQAAHVRVPLNVVIPELSTTANTTS